MSKYVEYLKFREAMNLPTLDERERESTAKQTVRRERVKDWREPKRTPYKLKREGWRK